MYESLGLIRDPFAPSPDEGLYWEDPERAGIRAAAREGLERGRGVWLRGEPGSGREALALRVLADLARRGRPVVVPGAKIESAEELVSVFLDATGDRLPGESDPLDRFAALYERFLGVFYRRGPVVFAVACDGLDRPATEEVAVLGALRVAGVAIAIPLLWGCDDPPIPGLQTVSVPPFTPEDLRAVLSHRISSCGCPNLLDPGALDHLARSSSGVRSTLGHARRHLGHLLFAGPEMLETRFHLPTAGPIPLLDPDDLHEAASLLSDLAATDA